MTTHGMRKHELYRTWAEMRYRCENPKKHNYKYYGGRGIKVCERWQDFANFVSDMGERPKAKGLTLDRVDFNGDYCPENCRWASRQEQMNNMRTNRVLMVNGTSMTMSEASRRWKVPVGTIWMRLKLGWGESDAAIRTVHKRRVYQRAQGRRTNVEINRRSQF